MNFGYWIWQQQQLKITSDNLNANLGSPFTWFKDSKSFLINVLPANRPALLSDKNDIPTGPTVATSTGKVSQNATYQDLLKTPKDETNFENLATSELAKVDLNGNLSGFAKVECMLQSHFHRTETIL